MQKHILSWDALTARGTRVHHEPAQILFRPIWNAATASHATLVNMPPHVPHLQHLQDQAQEVGRSVLTSACATHTLQVDRFLDQALGSERKTTLLPIHGPIDLLSHDVLDEVLE